MHRNLVVVLLMLAPLPAFARGGEEWFSAWSVSHGSKLTPPRPMSGTTVRMVVRPTLTGNQLRVKLENTMSGTPVVFSAAHIGVRGPGAEIVEGTNVPMTFDGQAGLTLAAGAGAYSDPVDFHVQAFQELTVSLDVASASEVSGHALGLITNYYAVGAVGADPSGAAFTPVVPATQANFPFYWVATVDVRSPSTTGTVVLFGDSITDGRCSTRDPSGFVQPDLYQRWGDVLAQRLTQLPANQAKGISNQGIAANRVLPGGGTGQSALERVQRDVLDRAGVTHVVFFIGTNDLNADRTAAQVIAGVSSIIDTVHAAGAKIIGVPVIPRGYNPSKEMHRLAVNAWVRTQAQFDGLIDFDQLLTDGGIPARLNPLYNCDGTHPNPDGYEAMGNFIDLNLFLNIGSWGNGK